MKIGVITFHDASNYGAALQAYATQQAISDLGYDAEIINYSNEYRLSKYSPWSRFSSAVRSKRYLYAVAVLFFAPGILLRNRAFRGFYKRFLNLSGPRIESKCKLEAAATRYDVIIAGSDQIWSYKNNGRDFSYLLEFAGLGAKKFSYASSFGLTEIPEDLLLSYKKCLTRLDSISVREKKGVELVEKLIGRKANLVLDPVFLHGRDFWLERSLAVREKDFVLFYMNENRFNRKMLACLKSFGVDKKIVSIGSLALADIFRGNYKVKNADGPQKFISYIYSADIVITTSYHAVVLCLIFNKPFYVLVSGDDGRDARILQVLEDYHLLDRAIYIETRLRDFSYQIDFSCFNDAWPHRRDYSLKFIGSSIES